MNRREVEKRRRRGRNIVFILVLILVFGAMNIKTGFLAFSGSKTAFAIDREFVNNMLLKDPVIKKVDGDIEDINKGKAEEELMIIREEIARKKEEERLRAQNTKYAYLTFDDGPSVKSTPAILEILEKNDIKATFFILGRMADTNPEVLKMIHDAGHAIGHHSYSHNYKHLYSSPDNFMAELEKTNRTFKNILGEDFETRLVRFPGGSHGAKKQSYARIVESQGYHNYDWNALNGDSEGRLMSKDYLMRRLRETTGNQKNLIVLMHDTDAKTTTVQSLQESIDFLRSKGYEFKKLEPGVLY